MTKADIARAVQEKASLTVKEATDAVELVLATLKETLAEGETVKFSGFGTFLVKKRAERKGRNLTTGEEIPVQAKWVVKFEPGEQFKAMVDSDNF
ncbi:MAG TPA: integration host factor subunit alpha [Thermodesulfovibrionia bacterium]|nr:integration host factor subunit alpha [Thermodesulfovibrionia bacterium]